MAKAVQQVPKKKKRVKAKTSSLLTGIKPLSEYEESKIKLSLYGRSGSGKTRFWSSFPGPILAILCSGGQGTNELDSVRKEDRAKVEPFYLNNCDELLTIAEELKTDTHFETVVIDHLTGVQDLRIAEILGLEEIPVQKSWGMADRKEYAERAENMKVYLRRFLDLKSKNVVFVTQEKAIVDDDDEKPELDLMPTIGPALSDSVLNWLNPAANFTARMFVTKKMKTVTTKIGGKKVAKRKPVEGQYEYCLWTGVSDTYVAKVRTPEGTNNVPSHIVNPDYDKFLKVIRGE